MSGGIYGIKKSIFAYGTIFPDKLFDILKLYLWNIKKKLIKYLAKITWNGFLIWLYIVFNHLVLNVFVIIIHVALSVIYLKGKLKEVLTWFNLLLSSNDCLELMQALSSKLQRNIWKCWWTSWKKATLYEMIKKSKEKYILVKFKQFLNDQENI